MATTILGGALQGVTAHPIRVEVDLLRRLPRISVVGLAASAVKESAERVRSAIASADLDFPRMRVVINLAPADIRKDGTALDLPMAIGILVADGQLPEDRARDAIFVGELGLGGDLRPVRGALPLGLLARALDKDLILPERSARQAALVPGVRVYAAPDLGAVVAHLRGELTLPRAVSGMAPASVSTVDLAEVRGQHLARRALEIAAAGAHHLLMLGPPGCGKSMLARRLPTILPSPSFEEALDTTRIHSAAGLLGDDPNLLPQRPFRAPHHSVSAAGLIGSRDLRPGEVALAHNGVLFLDEAPEFQRAVLEQLREPLEDGQVRITRAAGTVTYPTALTLVMAANPCPCGYRGSAACRCTDADLSRYLRKLSGPVLDRIDLHVPLCPVPAGVLLDREPSEDSATVRERVSEARARQTARGQPVPNGRLSASDLDTYVDTTQEARELLLQGVRAHGLSGRSAHRLLKVARTCADLDGTAQTGPAHVAEALGFRPQSGIHP